MLTLANVEVLPAGSAQWIGMLDRVRHDVYHTPGYHCLSGFGQEGTPFAFAYQEGELSFLWPYLLVPIAGAAGYHDVTSVYGYSGPGGSADPAFTARAWHALREHWTSQRVVSVFTRFHPILANFQMLDEIPAAKAGIRECGNTVSIDLTLPPDVQVGRYQKNLRQAIRKVRETGFVTTEDEDWTQAGAFVSVYQDTMTRCGSRPEYMVDESWVHNFRQSIGSPARLFVTKRDDAVAAAMIVMAYGQFLHCHLIGTASKYLPASPSKVLLDDVRIWGHQRGYGVMHLGGGVGGREDDLFHFKRKFSPLTHSFRTGNWILDETVYRELEARNRTRLAAKGVDLDRFSYFPSYRYNSSTMVD